MHILVLEDEPLIAVDIAATIAGAGWHVAGPVGSIPRALQLLDETPCEAAILDANLGGKSAAPVAERLQASNIPFIVLSGYSSKQLPGPLCGAPFLAKPYKADDLIALVRSLR